MVDNMKSSKGMLAQIPPAKLHHLLGEITSLMMLSPIHRKFQLRDIADIILPYINLNQFRIYHNQDKEPIAFVTWAFLSEQIEEEYLSGKAVLSEQELKSGEILYFMEFIAPLGHAKQVIHDLRTNLFPTSIAKSLRFTEQGKHRNKVRRFYGKNFN